MSRFEQLFNEAYNYYKSEKLELALATINKAEALPAEMSGGKMSIDELELFKASILFLLGDLENSQLYYGKVLAKKPNSVEACIGLGKTYYAANMSKEAKVMFEWAAKNEPENINALNALESINTILGYPKEHNSLFIEEQPTAQNERRDFNILFDFIYDKFLADEYEVALGEIDKVEKLFIEDLNMLKGNIYLATDDLDECKLCFEKVINANPSSIAAYNGLAKMYTNKNMYQDAKAMYELALKVDPKDDFAVLGLSEVNEKLGLPPVHSIYTFLADKQISNEINDILNEAYSLFEGGKYQESIDKLTLVENKIQNSQEKKKNELLSSVLNFKGFNYLSLMKLDEAHSTFEFSLRLNPGSSQACAGLGEYFYLKDQDKESKTMFEWAVKNNPENYFAIQGLGKVNKIFDLPLDHNSLDLGIPEEINDEFIELVTGAYSDFDNKNFVAAVGKIERAINLVLSVTDEVDSKKQLVSLYNFKGFSHLSLGENNKAKECFEYSLEKNSNSSQAAAGLGEILYLEGKDQEAKTMFEYALQYEPRNTFAISGLTKANKSLGLAENDNALVPKLKKDKTIKIGELIDAAYNQLQTKNYRETVRLLSEAELIVEDNFNKEESYETIAKINNFKGFAFLSLEETVDAKDCFEKALQLIPNSSQACAGLGEVFYLSGKDNEAKVMYEWALKNNAQNKYAILGLAKVNKALGLENNSSIA